MMRRPAVSLTAIALVLLVGIAYLAFGIFGYDPTRQDYTARLALKSSGGIEIGSPVLLTGYEIGEVTAIGVDRDGVAIDIRYDRTHPIPVDSVMTVETLSALGEPYVEFAPQSDGGETFVDGARIDARELDPVTISAASTRLVGLLDQFDPSVIAGLVDTLGVALDGTDAVMPRLQRSTTLLAATLMEKNPQLHELLSGLQAIGGDLDWLGPALEEGGPAWASVGDTVIKPLAEEMALLTVARDPSAYLTGNGLIPFLAQLNQELLELGPELKPLAPVLAPVVAEASSQLARLDIGALLTRALQTVGPDGAIQLELSVQPKGRK